MTKQDFIKRCEVAWQHATPEALSYIAQVVDAIMRLEGGQVSYWHEFMHSEYLRTQKFADYHTLANDSLAYQAVQFMAVLNHPCQKCAEDINAWHTRPAFCNHKEDNND